MTLWGYLFLFPTRFIDSSCYGCRKYDMIHRAKMFPIFLETIGSCFFVKCHYCGIGINYEKPPLITTGTGRFLPDSIKIPDNATSTPGSWRSGPGR